ncbi:MAG: HAD hydrolase family protein, partial [Thermodesulfobacteriota bacterium]
PVTRKRAEKLDIFCLSGIDDKKKTLVEYLSSQQINKDNVIYIGNDINDLEAMLYVGIPIAPKDAHPEIRKIASFITEARGGNGVIREFLDILNKQR